MKHKIIALSYVCRQNLYKMFVERSHDDRLQLFRYFFVGVSSAFLLLLVSVVLARAFGLRFAYAITIGFLISTLFIGVTTFGMVYPIKLIEVSQQLLKLAKKHIYAILAISCCLFFIGISSFALLGGTKISDTKGIAITYDEISFIPNGYLYQKTGAYFTNPEHPPLIKDIAALSYGSLDVKMPKDQLPKKILFEDQAQYLWGKMFLYESGNDTESIIFWARMSVLLVNAVLIFVLFLSLSRAWTKRAGFIAVFLITMSQFSIAHGSIVTLDFMSALFSVLSLVWFSELLKKASRDEGVYTEVITTSLLLAGALTSKLSTVMLIPVMLIISCVYAIFARRGFRWVCKKYVLSVLCIFVLSFSLVTVFYAWHTKNMTAEDIGTQLRISYDKDRLPSFGLTSLTAIAHWGPLGRGFAEFAHGIIKTNDRIHNGSFGVYFMGRFYGAEGAGLLYFPLLYLLKLQIMYHILSLVALVGVARIFINNKALRLKSFMALKNNPLPAILGSYVVVFGGVAVLSTLQIGLRHILPVILGLMVLVALSLDLLLARLKSSQFIFRNLRWIVALVATVMVMMVIWDYPSYLSSYNIMAGGTGNGYKVATDSNYDWGQDVKRLSAWKQANKVDKLYIDLFINPYLPIGKYLGDNTQRYNIAKDSHLPKDSYLAVSVHQYQLNTHSNLPKSKTYHSIDNDRVDRVGSTIFIYKIK